MNNQYWLIQLEMLLVRFSYLGVSSDIAALGLTELWGLYMHLNKMAGA